MEGSFGPEHTPLWGTSARQLWHPSAMHALPLMIGALATLAIAYRYYSAFLAAKVLSLDGSRVTPAILRDDGKDYHPTNRWILFGHHFAAITGAGPLIGPVLAMQFGFLPGYLWILVGVCLGGAVHDFVILSASIRRDGRSLAEIARAEVSPLSGLIASIAILFIVVIALAGLGLAVVNALFHSAWGTFTIAMSIPIALFMGMYLYRIRPGRVGEATAIGVAGMLAAVVLGEPVANSAFAGWFTFSKTGITLAIAVYGFVASVLPVWLLLCPRDYLSSFMKLGTIAFLIVGVCVVNPELRAPAFSQFVDGGGPIVSGKMFPFMFITIACGAISGFHALIASGTTPKMMKDERDARMIGFGAMLLEGLVGITALIAAACLHPGDYYAINVATEKFAAMGLSMVNLQTFEAEIGEAIAGRPGGAVSLAVGMAQIFSALPGMKSLLGYWYHFAIMFEALFILTTIDTGTRVARFLVQEFLGHLSPQLGRTDWMPGTVLSTGLVVVGWSYFILTGSIDTIWPMFGIANQLLASVALCVGTTVIVNSGKGRYAWVTLLPLSFVSVTTLTAGWMAATSKFLPMGTFQGYLCAGLIFVGRRFAGLLAPPRNAVPAAKRKSPWSAAPQALVRAPAHNWPALRSVPARTPEPALAGVPLGGHLQFVGRPGSHPSSAALLAVEPVPPCAGVTRLPPARRKASSGWNPRAASSGWGTPAAGQGLSAEDRGHRARGRALAPSDAGFALSDSPRFVGDRRATSSDRGAGLPASRPITRAARRKWPAPRCGGGRAAKIVARAAVVRLGPFHGRRLGATAFSAVPPRRGSPTTSPWPPRRTPRQRHLQQGIIPSVTITSPRPGTPSGKALPTVSQAAHR